MAKQTHYFDHASTTPVDPAVLRAMRPYFTKNFGNPSNLYELGRRAKHAIENASKKISMALDCQPEEIVYTGSATEADNLALLGVARANRAAGNKIIVSNIEHKAVLAACKQLAKEGFEIIQLSVQKNGLVNPQNLNKLLDRKTILVSIMYANNEIGTIQPIAKIGQLIKNFKKKHRLATTPLFHTDAAQAPQFLDCGVGRLGVDLMTISSHKLYGPKGVGALFVRRGTKISQIIFGGQQTRLRAGTDNVAGIIGMGHAIALAQKRRKTESARIKKLRNKMERGITKLIPRIIINGHKTKRLPNFLNISILDIEGEALLLYLDKNNIMASTGSACNSETLEPSHVLAALGNPYEVIHGSIRFTLGKGTGDADVNYVLKNLPKIVAKLRQISPLHLNLKNKKGLAKPEAFLGGQSPHFLKVNQENEKK